MTPPRPELRRRIEGLARPRVVAAAHGGDHDDHGTPPRPAVVRPVDAAHVRPGPAGGADGCGTRRARRRAAGARDTPRRPSIGAASAPRLRRWTGSRRSGVPVPAAVAVPGDMAARVAAGDTLARELVAGALGRWLDPGGRYAVRSSADGEDGSVHSFAGQLESRLDVAGRCRPRRDRRGRPPGPRATAPRTPRGPAAPLPTRIGVIVQVQVAATAAGIAFSRNPLTGLDETVVEAVPGGGETLAAEGRTPDRWIRRWGEYTESPVQPRVDQRVADVVAHETATLAAAWGGPLDLEWAHDGRTLWWLQARPMTGLDGLHVYSNRIARDVLPGVIKPLVWSVNVPVVNAAWIELLTELVGELPIRPDDLARSFGYRAYFDMTTLGAVFEALGMPRDALELLLGLPRGPEAPRFRPRASATVRHLPRLLGFTRRTLRRGRWTRSEVRALHRHYEALRSVDPSTLDELALLARVDELHALARRAAYANIVVPLVMLGYDRALSRQLQSAGIDPSTVDPARDRPDRASWDPTTALDALSAMLETLPDGAREDLESRGWTAVQDRPDLGALGVGLEAFLERFGHLSDSGNDFSLPTWREDPDHVVGLVLAHRSKAGPARDLPATGVVTRMSAARRPLAGMLWRRTGAFRVYRDAVGTTWARSYGLFRGTFLALGARLVARGVLDTPDDVFYLSLDELRALVAHPGIPAHVPGAPGPTPDEARALVATRRAGVAEASDLVVPEVVYGDAFVPRRADEVVDEELVGIPASRGSARGIARVVRSKADFGRVAPGDIIVIPFSDVAWTPLFARAAGAIAEAGGMLAHSAVVAREYGIPCIVSVPDACSRIPDGATVVIDGITGRVLVER